MMQRGFQSIRCTILCVILPLAAFGVSNAIAQTVRPDWAPDGGTQTDAIQTGGSEIQQTVYHPQDINALPATSALPKFDLSDETSNDQLTREEQLDAFVAQLPEGDSHLVKFIEMLQWAVLVSIVAVAAALLIRKFKPNGIQLSSNTLIEHLASLRVNNQFHAHVLEIRDQRFLVTTDRNGVKTVNQMTSVGDFETALEEVV